MAKTLKELKEERAAKLDAVKALRDKAKGEKRDFTPEEVTEFEGFEEEIRTLNTEIRAKETAEKADLLEAARQAGRGGNQEFSEKDEKDLRSYSIRKVMLAAASRTAPDGIEAEMQQEAEKELREFGQSGEPGALLIPSIALRRMYAQRDMTATGGTNGNQGGVTIETEVNGYIQVLRERSLALQLGTRYLSGLTGNFDMPRENAVYTPSFKAENADADESNPTFTKVSFSPKRATGYVDVSKQLLIQSSADIEYYLRQQLLLGHAQLLDKVIFNGSSANDEPVGILNDPDVTGIAIGTNGGNLTKDLVDQLIQALQESFGYSDAARFVTSPAGARHMKNVKLDAGSGLFLWEKGNTVDGIPAYTTTHIPKNISKGTGTNLTAAIMGDFSAGMVGQWGGTEILVDPYTQGLKGLIRFIPAQYLDYHVVQPARLKAIKDINPVVAG